MSTSEPSEGISHTVQEHLLMLDSHLCVKAASESFYTAFMATPGEMLGKKLATLGDGQWDIPALLTLLNELPEIGGELNDFAMEHEFPFLGRRAMLVGGRRLPRLEHAQSSMILLSIRNAPAQKRIPGEAGDSRPVMGGSRNGNWSFQNSATDACLKRRTTASLSLTLRPPRW